MRIEITIELLDGVAEHLQAHLAQTRKPPVHDAETGTVISQPRYVRGMELEQWIAELVSANAVNALRDNPTPAMLEHRRRIEAIEQELRSSLAPTISVRKAGAEK